MDERIVSIKINKKAAAIVAIGMTIQGAVLAWLLYPRKVKG